VTVTSKKLANEWLLDFGFDIIYRTVSLPHKNIYNLNSNTSKFYRDPPTIKNKGLIRKRLENIKDNKTQTMEFNIGKHLAKKIFMKLFNKRNC